MVGKVCLKFNSTMIPNFALTEEDLHKNSSRLLEVEIYQEGIARSTFKNFSNINNETVLINDTVYPSLEVRLKPDEPEDPCAERLGFTWECIEFDEE